MGTETDSYIELQRTLEQLRTIGTLLAEQKREQASDMALSMREDVSRLHVIAMQGQAYYEREQRAATADVAAIRVQIGRLQDEIRKTGRDIASLEVEIAKKGADLAHLGKQMQQMNAKLGQARRDLQEHRDNLARLNDRSVGSIFRSIFCLGLDRAVLGIKSLVDQDQARIRTAEDEIRKYGQELEKNQKSEQAARKMLSALKEQQGSLQAIGRKLDENRTQMERNEQTLRAKMTFWLEMALFMGRLDTACTDIDHSIIGLQDIIGELNDQRPRIVDFTGAEVERISLAAALDRFEALLRNGEAATRPAEHGMIRPLAAVMAAGPARPPVWAVLGAIDIRAVKAATAAA